MPKITYIEHSGKSHTIEVANGLTIMEGAVQNNVPGIDADCGGSCACATCHVYVEKGDYPDIDRNEAVVLKDLGVNQQDNSRLSCQIEITDSNDGDHFVVAPN